MGCIRDAKNPIVSDLSKHVDLKHKFLVDHMRKGDINIHYFPTSQVIKDLLMMKVMKIKCKKWEIDQNGRVHVRKTPWPRGRIRNPI